MVSRKYTINRDDMHGGSLLTTCQIYSEQIYCEGSATRLYTTMPTKCRSMLFVPDEKKFANDLLYNSPQYPILNVTNPELYVDSVKNDRYDRFYKYSANGILVVDKTICLGPLLELLGYGKELNYDNIIEIRQRIFNGHIGNKKLNSLEINNLLQFIEKQLSKEYADSIRSLGCISLDDSLNNELINKQDIFAPSKAEANVRKLSRYKVKR